MLIQIVFLNTHLQKAYIWSYLSVDSSYKNMAGGKEVEDVPSTNARRKSLCRGLMLWLFVGPTGVYLLDFFCSGIQFNLLLSPYPCFISLLYLDLYVLGDDALIS